MSVRTKLIVGLAAILFGGVFMLGMGGQANQSGQKVMAGLPKGSPKRADKVVLSDTEWRKRLTAPQYNILRQDGTEQAFTGKYNTFSEKGTYYCAGCGLPLFSSDTKFDAGEGWPSFFKPIEKNVWLKRDNSDGMSRIEVRCARCDGHLGHLFDDAPQMPTGLRFCIDSDALTFRKGR